MMSVALLGPLSVSRDGIALAMPQSKKTRALLAFLVLADRPQRRDRLVSLFWDVPDDPRGSLRWSLSKLRELFDEPSARRIVADREVVRFDRQGAEVDVAALGALEHRGLDSADISELEAAAGLFRGELAEGLDLPNCLAYQAWLVAEREQALHRRAKLLHALVGRLEAEPPRALVHARALAGIRPHDAAERARLIRLLAAADLRAEAEEQYRAGLQLLQDGDGADLLHRLWQEVRGDRHRRGAAPLPPAEQAPTAPSPPPRAPPSQGETAMMLNRPAVAVLPFENLSGDPDQDYFADGISDDLITALCHWRWFPVIARNSSFAFKGRHADATAVGRELGARYLVQGTVRRAGEQVRVSAQLVDASLGQNVWAQRFDRRLGDVFALQDELTEQIVTQLEPELAHAERRRTERVSARNLDAWDLNLRASAAIWRGRPRDLQDALDILDRSLALEPDSSQTHALRAYCLYHRALLDWTDDPRNVAGAYLADARRAVELDERNWMAHALLAMSVLWHQRDYDLAAESAQRAVDLNPGAALAHQFLGCVRLFDGNPSASVPHLTAALRLNPRRNAATLLLADLSLAHLLTGQPEEAVYYARRAVAEFSGDIRAWQRLTAALGHLGYRDEAAKSLAQLTRLQKDLSRRYFQTTYPFRDPADLQRVIGGLEKAGWTA